MDSAISCPAFALHSRHLSPRCTFSPSKLLRYFPARSSSSHRIVCRSGRRHHRRRDSDSLSAKNRTGFGREDAYEAEDSEQEKVVILLDLQALKDRAAGATETAKRELRRTAVRAVRLGEAIQEDSREFWRDLRSSISVQKDKRIVISIRRSSIEFAANALFWSLLLVAVWKILVKAAKKYRWGWDASFDSETVVRRDRSLGGKEVLVGKNYGNIFANSQSRRSTTNGRLVNPLDTVEISRSEKEMAKQRGAPTRSVRNLTVRLPSWWPAPEVLRATANLERDAAQKEASFLARVIMDKRLSGRDFQEEDTLQLRRICKHSGAAVRFDTINIRDALYRAAIDLVLSSCGRMGSISADVGGEKATDFLGGLADNIGLEAERAATMVNAAVAARTRSTFLQAWALYVQGKLSEAEEEISRISHIHAVLPSDNNSPEMEMVAQGLGRHLSLDERKHLLQMYLRVGSSSTHRIASEALGLYSNKERVRPSQ